MERSIIVREDNDLLPSTPLPGPEPITPMPEPLGPADDPTPPPSWPPVKR